MIFQSKNLLECREMGLRLSTKFVFHSYVVYIENSAVACYLRRLVLTIH